MSRREQQEKERERERERETRRAVPTAASSRKNDYFLPKDGIDREVITADICRYLGNDALVRPGTYENPQTRQIQQGYFINAYRNLTSAMITDLKADSARWEAERDRTSSSVRATIAPEYRSSQIHQSRQYYGPTEAPQQQPPPQQFPTSTGAQVGNVYESGQYQDQMFGQPAAAAAGGYIQPQQDYPIQQDNYYVHGGALRPEVSGSRQGRGIPVTQAPSGVVPRDPYAATTPTYPQQADPRYAGYSQPQNPQGQQYATQQQGPTDPSYGRAVPATGAYDQPEYSNAYDYNESNARGYQDQSAYTQSMPQPSSTITAEPSRRNRDRDSHSRHHRDTRR